VGCCRSLTYLRHSIRHGYGPAYLVFSSTIAGTFFASLLIAAGKNVKYVASQLGHHSAAFTLEQVWAPNGSSFSMSRPVDR
jgi:hypothetical protein